MRIGQNTLGDDPTDKDIWQVLLANITETAEWMPPTYWNKLNLSTFDAVRTGILDTALSPWSITHIRSQVEFISFIGV